LLLLIDYVEEGDPKGEPLLLVHGFPDLWYGWRHQIGFLAKLGYRVLVVDTIGYGQTVSPLKRKCRPEKKKINDTLLPLS